MPTGADSCLYFFNVDKKPSIMRTKQQTDLRNQQAAFLTPLFYLKESQNVSQGLVSWNSADHEQALIDGSRSLLLEIHGKNFPQHLPSRIARNDVKAYEALAFPYPAESSAIGNTQRHNGGTHMGPHNLQADALLRRLDNSQTRCRKSPQSGRRTTTHCTKFPKHCGSSRKMSGTQQHKLCTQLHVYRRSRFQSFELLLQLSQLFLLRLVVATV